MLGHGGIINKGLRALGLIDAPLPFLLYSPFSVVLVMTYFSLPFAVVAIYASLEKMDWALVDAAGDLGARRSAPSGTSRCPRPCPAWSRRRRSPSCRWSGCSSCRCWSAGPSSVMIAPLIANQMQAFQLGLGAAMSFIVALIVMAALALPWRYLDLDRLER